MKADLRASVAKFCQGARSSAAERTAHNRLVVGSNPTGPTFLSFSRVQFNWLDSFAVKIGFDKTLFEKPRSIDDSESRVHTDNLQ
jgi:hypothetical protein